MNEKKSSDSRITGVGCDAGNCKYNTNDFWSHILNNCSLMKTCSTCNISYETGNTKAHVRRISHKNHVQTRSFELHPTKSVFFLQLKEVDCIVDHFFCVRKPCSDFTFESLKQACEWGFNKISNSKIPVFAITLRCC